MHPLYFGTDCSGADAPLVALKQVLAEYDGQELRYEFGSDIMPLCRSILRESTPAPRMIYEDLTTRDHSTAPRVHLYVAGFPCQPFSSVGTRRGLDDVRGTVFFGILEYLRSRTPAVFVLENVRGLLTHENGRTWATMLDALESVADYVVEYRCVSPHEVGSPQTRARLFIVGRCRRQLGELASRPMEWPVAQILPVGALDSLLLDNHELIDTEPSVFRELVPSARRSLEALLVQVTRKNTTLEDYAVYLGCAAGCERLGTRGVVPCLRLRCERIYLPGRGRYISSREALRLQGFPEDHPPVECSVRQRMRLAGNAISVPVMVEILRPLVQMLIPSVATLDLE